MLLAAANVYTSLKISYIDGCAVAASLLAFGFFAARRPAGRTPYGALENNITQTVASSAAVMSFVTGIVGPLPALALMGLPISSTAAVLIGAGLGVLGVFVGVLLRRRLVVEEALPFPTGLATGEVINTMFGARHLAMRRVLLMGIAAGIAGIVTWFRDGRPAIIPQGFNFGGTLGGVAAAALGIGVSVSPVMLATGSMIGLRGVLPMLAGAVASRVVLAPWIVKTGLVANAEVGTLNSWLIWPATGLLVSASFLPLLLDGGAVVRSIRQIKSLRRSESATARSRDDGASPRVWALLLLASVAAIFVGSWLGYGVAPLALVIALVLALSLANVAARATGETDLAPAGPFGTLGLIATANRGTVSGIVGNWVGSGIVTQTSQTLWAFRAGRLLGASPRAQTGAQLLGVLVGAVVTVPVYAVVAATYGIGNEKMPAIAGLSVKATSEAMHGLSALPKLGGTAVLVAFAFGTALTVLGRLRIGRFVPSAAAIGVGFMLPFSYVAAAVIGAVLAVAVRKLRPGETDEASMLAFAAGGMAGESIVGVTIAALAAIGLL